MQSNAAVCCECPRESAANRIIAVPQAQMHDELERLALTGFGHVSSGFHVMPDMKPQKKEITPIKSGSPVHSKV